jgi:hypothetical protein
MPDYDDRLGAELPAFNEGISQGDVSMVTAANKLEVVDILDEIGDPSDVSISR